MPSTLGGKGIGSEGVVGHSYHRAGEGVDSQE